MGSNCKLSVSVHIHNTVLCYFIQKEGYSTAAVYSVDPWELFHFLPLTSPEKYSMCFISDVSRESQVVLCMLSRFSLRLILLIGSFKSSRTSYQVFFSFSNHILSCFPFPPKTIFCFSVLGHKSDGIFLILHHHLSIAFSSCLAWQPLSPFTLNQCDLHLNNFLHEFTDSL